MVDDHLAWYRGSHQSPNSLPRNCDHAQHRAQKRPVHAVLVRQEQPKRLSVHVKAKDPLLTTAAAAFSTA